jgi:hypothetical protein
MTGAWKKLDFQKGIGKTVDKGRFEKSRSIREEI